MINFVNHPIAKNALAKLRNKNTELKEYREYSKILTIAVANTNTGNKVSTVGIVDSLSDNNYAVFSFKGTYEDQELSRYKALRVKLHEPYTI